jgi:hypothetical protein
MTSRVQEVTKLRAEFRRNGKLRLEYMAAMSRLLREHGIGIEDESLAHLVPADIAELSASGTGDTAKPTSGPPPTGVN